LKTKNFLFYEQKLKSLNVFVKDFAPKSIKITKKSGISNFKICLRAEKLILGQVIYLHMIPDA